MKFISFALNKEEKFGIINNESITDLTGKISGADTLKALIEKQGISEAKKYANENPGNISLDDIQYLPLIPNPVDIRSPSIAGPLVAHGKNAWKLGDCQ